MRSKYLQRIYRLKLLLLGTVLALIGILVSLLADWLSTTSAPHLFVSVLSAVSDVLVVTGAIGIAVDFFTGKDKEAADTERLRGLLKEAAPDFRDAVISGFAETPDNMRGVATDETLDRLATNALALRLGDDRFASEIYSGLLEQAIRTPERWHNMDVAIKLSDISERSVAGAPRSTGPSLFEVVVTWDYEVVPSTQIHKFACVSVRDEFRELLSEVPATATWYLSPKTGFLPSDKAAYELLQFSVDGEERPIRRTAGKTRQTYSVDLGDEALRAGKSVKIRHTLRAVMTQEGHWLQIAMTQPTKDLSISLDYTDTDIAVLRVTDLVSSAKQPWVTDLSQHKTSRSIALEVPGWLLPQAQVTFIWTLAREVTALPKAAA